MPSVPDLLDRWTRAGLLDAATAERISQFEASQQRPAGLRWQVLLALIFGAILLATGVSLFVAAHWDQLSPSARFAVVMGMIVVLHAAAIAAHDRFAWLATTLHGIGTVAAGAAVALVGQIFNIQEHWPAGILLWALCALAGWALLRDQVQQTIALLLLPTWLICEWSARTAGYRGEELYLARMVAVIAAAYLVGFLDEKRKLVFGVLFAASSVTLIACMTGLTEYWELWQSWQTKPAMPINLQVLGWLCIAVLPLLLAWRLNRKSVVPVAVVLVTVILLPHLYRMSSGEGWWGGPGNIQPTPSLPAHIWVALVAAFFAWWGVQQASRAMVNYGIVCFALAVLWFYFSSVMGKLERSFSLMMLGVLFLGGGWALEKMRRKLVHHIQEAA